MKKGYLYILIATILFSSMEIALKTLAGAFHPIQMTLTRFLVGGIVLLPFALRALARKQISLDKKSLGYFALLGLMGVVVSMSFYQLAVERVKASVVAVLFSSNPIFVLFFAYFILREAITKRHIAALILEIAGIIAIINPFQMEIDGAGLLFTVLATVTFALYGVLGKKKCRQFGGVVVTCFSFLFGSLEMLLLAVLTKIGPIADFITAHGMETFADIPLLAGYTPDNILTVLYIAVGVTGIGYAAYFLAMEAASANTASLVFFFKPALAPVLALVILGEAIPLHMFLGILLILAGSLTTILPDLLEQKRQKRPIRTEEI